MPCFSANRMNACMSLGRQNPPKPRPALRKYGPMRGSSPIARVTSSTFPPSFSQRSAMRLA